LFTKKVVVKNETGLHARPASQFVQIASKYKSDITLKVNDKIVNPKSIISLLSVGITYNSEVIVSAEGEDAKQAVDALVKFIENLKE